MWLLAFRSLWSRPARTLFTALAIALGVGMIFAMRMVSLGIGTAAQAARESRLAGADLEITSAANAKFPASVAERVAAESMVQIAAPILRAPEGALDATASAGGFAGAALSGTGLTLLGVDPARTLNNYELVAGADLTGFQNLSGLVVLLPADWAALHGLGVASTVTLATGQQTRAYRVVGLLKTEFGSPPTAWMPLDTLQAGFEAPGQATGVLVRLKPEANKDAARDALQKMLGAQFIVTSASGGAGLRTFFTLTNLALPLAGFIILLAGAFLVFNAFAITLAERRREIGQLRALGMTRAQVLAQTLLEALLTALFGSGLGLLFGWALGYGVTATISALQGGSAPAISIPLDGVLLALGAGVAVTLGVTASLAVQAARVSPLEALRNDSRSGVASARLYRLLAVLVAGLLLATVALYFNALRAAEVVTEGTTYAFIFAPMLTLALAALCALPLWVEVFIRAGQRMARMRLARVGVAVQLAAGSLGRQRGRAVLTSITLMLSLMTIVTLSGVTLFFTNYLTTGTGFLRADAAFSRPLPPGMSFADLASLPSLPPVPAALQADIDALKDIADISSNCNVSLPGLGIETGMGDQYAFGMSLSKIRDSAFFPVTQGSWAEAEKYFAAGPALMLPELTARRLNKHPGDVIEVDTLKGKVPFTVAVVGGGFPIIMPEVAVEYFASYPFIIFFDAKPGVTPREVQDRVQALLRKHPGEAAEFNTRAMSAVVDSLTGPVIALFSGLTSLSGIVAALGIVVTLIASVLERQREIGTLRAIGMSRNHVRGMVVLEAGLLGLAGASLGALAGMGMAYLFGQLIMLTIKVIAGGVTFEAASPPWGVALAGMVTGPAIAMLTALWPADRAASVNPAEAMRAEGATGFLKPAEHLGPTGVRGLIARMPLAAKLSLSIGLVFVATIAALTAIRANYERQLLEDNIGTFLGRITDTAMHSNRDQLPAEVTALTPQILFTMRQQAGTQVEALQAQFQQSGSKYDFTLKYLFITDPDLKVIYSDKPEFIGRTLTETMPLNSSFTAVRITAWTGERVFEAVAPIENQSGKRVGIFQAGLSTAPVDSFIQQVLQGSLGLTAAALAIAIGLTLFFTRRALAPVAQLAEASDAVAQGDLSQRVPETRWDEVGRLSRSFNDMVKGLNERERIRDLFGRYVSREVQQEVLAGRVTLRGERKTITVLYCDMRGSTTFAESYAPEDVMAALNQYFEVIILATEAHGGIVNRFVGDAAVCVFGAPTEYRDHAERAVQAALSMREGLAYVNQKRATLGLPTLNFGIGLNTGEVTAGATGSEERQEYTVIGDAMNLGARIQELNKTFPDYGVLLSEYTRAALGPKAEALALVDLGEAEIRGKSKPVRVFGLL